MSQETAQRLFNDYWAALDRVLTKNRRARFFSIEQASHRRVGFFSTERVNHRILILCDINTQPHVIFNAAAQKRIRFPHVNAAILPNGDVILQYQGIWPDNFSLRNNFVVSLAGGDVGVMETAIKQAADDMVTVSGPSLPQGFTLDRAVSAYGRRRPPIVTTPSHATTAPIKRAPD